MVSSIKKLALPNADYGYDEEWMKTFSSPD
jgi:hypothetical protein